MADKDLREEVAELAAAVRDLRDREVADELRSLRAEVERLRAEHTAPACHGHCCVHVHCNWGHCGCFTVHSYAIGPQPYVYPQVWYGTVTSGGTSDFGGTVTTTNAASGCNPGATTLSISN